MILLNYLWRNIKLHEYYAIYETFIEIELVRLSINTRAVFHLFH